MSNEELIPCEYCDELIEFEEYSQHTIQCNNHILINNMNLTQVNTIVNTLNNLPDIQNNPQSYEQFVDVIMPLFNNVLININQQIGNIGNSYEELSQLSEQIGNHEIGISKQELNKKFPILPVLEKQDCAICLETIKKEYRQLSCNHNYCVKCIDEWLSKHKNCPICKKELN